MNKEEFKIQVWNKVLELVKLIQDEEIEYGYLKPLFVEVFDSLTVAGVSDDFINPFKKAVVSMLDTDKNISVVGATMAPSNTPEYNLNVALNNLKDGLFR
ncbi:hypothetical protein SDC9_30510 [bioreactor metagenome]|uniref:Uncharacterized protein n=1 Tax=bioreactor metagenome TaxID=1076179 RepID=A0A644V0L4_9ZZZZ|nr:hypothetical protein [Methanobrevibacter sp.]MEA4957557.1 hypothetical protein [Methanobrevibacter sp.]